MQDMEGGDMEGGNMEGGDMTIWRVGSILILLLSTIFFSVKYIFL